jgi:hypothetical protein
VYYGSTLKGKRFRKSPNGERKWGIVRSVFREKLVGVILIQSGKWRVFGMEHGFPMVPSWKGKTREGFPSTLRRADARHDTNLTGKRKFQEGIPRGGEKRQKCGRKN